MNTEIVGMNNDFSFKIMLYYLNNNGNSNMFPFYNVLSILISDLVSFL